MKGNIVVVTGASGFVAKHTIRALLRNKIYHVRGTVRDEEEERIARNNVSDGDHLKLVCIDLFDNDEKWKSVIKGSKYLIHIASPFPMKQPRDREALVPVAKEGTLRVVRAALEEESIKRIVVVSSIVAMCYRKGRPKPTYNITENDFTDPEWGNISAYPVSKTRAELALWKLVDKNAGAKEKVVVVNPGMIWGPMADDTLSTSSEMCRLMLSGSYPVLPKNASTIVDVRDVADILVACLTAPDLGGRRLIAAAGTLSMMEISNIIREAFPQYSNKLAKYELPNWLVRILVYFDRNLELVLPDLETRVEADSAYVTELTGVKFRSAKEAVVAMAQSVVDLGLI